jgi:hypothetical protein
MRGQDRNQKRLITPGLSRVILPNPAPGSLQTKALAGAWCPGGDKEHGKGLSSAFVLGRNWIYGRGSFFFDPDRKHLKNPVVAMDLMASD